MALEQGGFVEKATSKDQTEGKHKSRPPSMTETPSPDKNKKANVAAVSPSNVMPSFEGSHKAPAPSTPPRSTLVSEVDDLDNFADDAGSEGDGLLRQRRGPRLSIDEIDVSDLQRQHSRVEEFGLTSDEQENCFDLSDLSESHVGSTFDVGTGILNIVSEHSGLIRSGLKDTGKGYMQTGGLRRGHSEADVEYDDADMKMFDLDHFNEGEHMALPAKSKDTIASTPSDGAVPLAKKQTTGAYIRETLSGPEAKTDYSEAPPLYECRLFYFWPAEIIRYLCKTE